MNISIIIPTYNRCNYIKETIFSFLNQNFHDEDYELIISDNNSNDETSKVVKKIIKENPNAQIRYILERKQGVHFARNSAAKLAKYELLYFTDDDMIADPNLLIEIVQPFIFNKDVAMATGRVLPKWLSPPPKWVLKYNIGPTLSLLDPPTIFSISKTVEYMYSCHQAIKKDVFFMAEGYNPENTKGVWIGDGENGLNAKVLELGYLFAYNGNSITRHCIPQERLTQKYLNKRFGNSGYVHAYSYFRKREPNNIQLLFHTIGILIFTPLKINMKHFYAFSKTGDLNIFRFSIANNYYIYNRIKYNLKIMLNPRWKKFVLKKDWLTNDLEYYNEL